MVAPSTLSLELIVLFLSAGGLALSGVLAIALVEPRRAGPDPEARQRAGRSMRRELVVPPVVATLLVALIGLGLLRALPSRLGSAGDGDLALVAGALGGLAVTLLALGVTILSPRLDVDPTGPRPTGARTRRGWGASASILAGSGGLALLTLVGLYVVLDGREPAMIAAVLGAALAALAGRASWRFRADAAPVPPEVARRTAWIRSMAPVAVAHALDVYLLFLAAATAASVLAFVPSEVRVLQPNAVLFPVAALAAVFVASLVAVLFATGEDAPTGSLRRVAELGPTAFGFVALLALAPPYLPGGLGLFLSGVAGLLAGPAVVLLWSNGRDAPSAPAGAFRFVRAAIPAFVFGALVVGAYWVANLSWHGSVDLSTSNLGTYGIGIAAVTCAGTLGGLSAIDLGGRLNAALNAAGEARDAPTPDVRRDRFTSAVRVGGVFAVGLASLVLVSAFVALVPLQAGVAPGSLVTALAGASEGRLLAGVVLGLLLALLVAKMFAPGAAVGPTGPRPGDDRGFRPQFGRWSVPLLLGAALPLFGGEVLGAVGLVGLAVGALLGTLWHGFTSELILVGSPDGGPAPTLLPTLALAVATALTFGAALYAGLPL
jgi:hypothetical protein